MLSRRSFLGTVGAMAGATMCRPFTSQVGAGASSAATGPHKLGRIGIQAYTVRHLLTRDFDGTLARIAALRYTDVELWGHRSRSPAAVRATLDRLGLAAPSSHFDFSDIRDDDGRLADAARVIGQEFLTSAWIDEKLRATTDQWPRLAEEFNRTGERLNRNGLRFAHHNHESELRVMGDQTLLEYLLVHTDPLLVSFQMDVFWTVRAGADPVDLIRRHPDRFVMLHIKDSSGPPAYAQVDIGSGTINFGAVLRADLDRQHVVKHVFIEHDEPRDPIAFAQRSIAYLKSLEF